MKVTKHDISDFKWVFPFPAFTAATDIFFHGVHQRVIFAITLWKTCWVLSFKSNADLTGNRKGE